LRKTVEILSLCFDVTLLRYNEKKKEVNFHFVVKERCQAEKRLYIYHITILTKRGITVDVHLPGDMI
jgi:hypothetical protein